MILASESRTLEGKWNLTNDAGRPRVGCEEAMDSTRMEFLMESLKAKPKDPFLRYALAMELAGAGRDEEAWAQLEILLHEQAEYLPTYYQAGMLLGRLGRMEEARRILERGVKLAQERGNTHTAQELGSALAELEDAAS